MGIDSKLQLATNAIQDAKKRMERARTMRMTIMKYVWP